MSDQAPVRSSRRARRWRRRGRPSRRGRPDGPSGPRRSAGRRRAEEPSRYAALAPGCGCRRPSRRGTPSVQVMPAPRQTTASATQNHDLRACRVRAEPLQVLADRRVLAVGGAADPAHVRLGLAPLAARVVGEALGGDGGAGQPVPVDGRPEAVRVLVGRLGAPRPPGEHSGAGVPAARVLAVAALVVRDAVARPWRCSRRPAGAAVHGPVHGREEPVPDGFGGGRAAVPSATACSRARSATPNCGCRQDAA